MKLFVATKAFILREGNLLLLRESSNYKDGTELGKWDVLEESGLFITSSKIFDVCETFPVIHDEDCHIVRIYYLCTANGDVHLSGDHDAYEWVNPNDLGDKIVMEDVARLIKSLVATE